VIKKAKHAVKTNAATGALMIAMFFNPLGFDALFALVMKWTGSYWVTDAIFYGISILFFLLYTILSRKDKKKKSLEGA
jgi:hypothetical protein